MTPEFSINLFVWTGLQKKMYFERLDSAHPLIFAYKAYRIRYGKPGAVTPFYVPERFNFILQPSERAGLFRMTRRDIQRLRKNNPLKRAYLTFRRQSDVGLIPIL